MPHNHPIYHITHIDNLPSILTAGCIWSDRRLQAIAGGQTVIGFDSIKRRRLNEIEVSCHPGTFVGDYVPFYFCPRSVMLYVIHKRNVELQYQGGQDRILHLVSSLRSVTQSLPQRRWAFTDGNAGAYTIRGRFRSDLNEIDTFVEWTAVGARDWRDPTIRERKQAEFLVDEHVPWTDIDGIGVKDEMIAAEIRQILLTSTHLPTVTVEPDWYY